MRCLAAWVEEPRRRVGSAPWTTERSCPASTSWSTQKSGRLKVVIPIEIRKSFGLGEKDPLEISVKDETILLSKPQSSCVFCGTDDPLEEYRGRSVCRSCIAELATQDG